MTFQFEQELAAILASAYLVIILFVYLTLFTVSAFKQGIKDVTNPPIRLSRGHKVKRWHPAYLLGRWFGRGE